MFAFIVFVLVVQGVLAVPLTTESQVVENTEATDLGSVAILVTDNAPSTRELHWRSYFSPKTYIDKFQKLNPLYWISDEDESKLDKIEEKTRVLYKLIKCGNSQDARCKKWAKHAEKLFKESSNNGSNVTSKPANSSEASTKTPEELPSEVTSTTVASTEVPSTTVPPATGRANLDIETTIVESTTIAETIVKNQST